MRYFDDLSPGDRFSGGPVTVSEADITTFAQAYDPQPFHLDHTAADSSIFGGLAASGWHTAALSMRMVVDSDARLAAGYVGLGVEDMSWPRPVRPGDTLRIEQQVVDTRLSGKRPGSGIVKVRVETFNQNNELVMRWHANLLVPRAPARSSTTLSSAAE
ncbi:acyl dehydratase [Azospirillum fermentarium]|uniref:MaoC family dehydratase n=1 Tax=Azospirillum fermentarium TaxID=1233114 RepID=UPI002225C732|nr:MaoC family dehydratase [Azospirillum fermentarium]MCW2246714.1 acyl dehydratase [Azospirillum fermentarium]